MLINELIGRTAPPYEWVITRQEIRRFAYAIGDENPLFHDTDAARSAGFGDIIAPPTFPIIFRSVEAFKTGCSELLFADLDTTRMLNGEQVFTYKRPIQSGDVLTCTTEIDEVVLKEGRSGPNAVISLLKRGWDTSGHEVFSARKLLFYRLNSPEEYIGLNKGSSQSAASSGAQVVGQPKNQVIKQAIPQVTLGPITPIQLASYAVACGDNVLLHLDNDFARQAGYPSVIAHGTLTMAALAQVATNWLNKGGYVHSFKARFVGVVYKDDTVTCFGDITQEEELESYKKVTISLLGENQKSQAVITGTAEVLYRR